MQEEKYNIMFQFDRPSYQFHKEGDKTMEFDTPGEAIEYAMGLGYSCGFIIVQKVDYNKLVTKAG